MQRHPASAFTADGRRGPGFNRNQGAARSFEQGRGQWLNYQSAQRKNEPVEKTQFSSFFAPQKPQVVRSQTVELGLLIKKHWVGQLIGKKGTTIKEIRQKSNGANIDFGDEDVTLEASTDKWEQSPWPETGEDKYKVCAISGQKEQATEASKAIAEVIGEFTQSEDNKLEFLVPESYVGIFIGKKGAHLKEMKKGTKNVSINVHRKPICLWGNKVVPCVIFGPSEGALKVIERAANWLGEISIKVQEDKEMEEEKVMMNPGQPGYPVGIRHDRHIEGRTPSMPGQFITSYSQNTRRGF